MITKNFIWNIDSFMNMIISHIRPIDGVIQTNEEHQIGVAHKAEMRQVTGSCFTKRH